MVARAVLDTPVLTELFDRGREDLVDEVMGKYSEVAVP